jgi:hypothetical protein
MMSYESLTHRTSAALAMALLVILSTASSLADTPPVERPALEVNAAETADPTGSSGVAPEAVYSPEGISDGPQRGLSPMMMEIQAVVELGRSQTLELESQAAGAPDEESILDIQRQIEELAQETELELLRVQVRHARLAGREELASKIEQDIADIQNPPVARVRLERPELDSQ